MKKLITLIIIFVLTNTFAQDQVKVMYYNLLNFPSSTPPRIDDLKKIVQYSKPDLFLVNELESNSGATQILNDALNQNGTTYYQKAAFINGPDTDNMLFYNSQKFGLLTQKKIPTVLRDINEYILYYKDPNISATSDTIYFYMYSLHLKAGSTESAQRNIEITTLRNYLNTKTNIENVFVGGDFNMYSGSEPAYTTIKNSNTLALKDPIFASGSWHNNSGYAYTHTQSTRTQDLGDGAWGGMDDRFDFIFVSDDIMSGTKAVKYIPNTYTPLGQDGLRFNQAINSPANTVVPDSIANALLYMSDHLPIMMDVDVNYITNSIVKNNMYNLKLVYNKTTNQLVLNKSITNATFKLITLTGKVVFNSSIKNLSSVIDLDKTIANGIYLWQIEKNNEIITGKLSIQ